MKLLFISHASGVAGAERSLVELVRAATEAGHAAVVVVPSTGPLVELLRSVPDVRVVVRRGHNWIGNRSRGLIGLIRLLQCALDLPGQKRVLMGERPDLVVVNSTVAPGFMFLAHTYGYPLSVVLSESLFDNPTLKSFLSASRIRDLIMRWSHGSVLAISEFVAKDWPGSPVIWPPVEPRYLHPETPAARTRKSKAALRLGMVGTIDPAKGQQDFITALRILASRGIEVEGWIAGGGTPTDIAALRAFLEQAPTAVRLTTEWVDARDVYRWSDLTAMCSRAEAFGKVTLESLLSGVPVVGYATGGTTELASLGGVVLTEPSPASLADSIARIANDGDALSEIASSFSPRQIAQHVQRNSIEALEAAISTARPGARR